MLVRSSGVHGGSCLKRGDRRSSGDERRVRRRRARQESVDPRVAVRRAVHVVGRERRRRRVADDGRKFD